MGGTNAWRQARIAAGLCVDCGEPRPATHADRCRCPACAAKHKAANDRLRRAHRLEGPWGDMFDGDPLPMGGAAPRLGSVAVVKVALSTPALEAIDELKRRDAARIVAAGGKVRPYRVSRIIRETIHLWASARSSGGYRDPNRWAAHRGLAVTFHADAATLAILDREARAHFHGSRAATVRAMLVTRVNPPLVCAVGLRRDIEPVPRWE
jgi:hypothetical protein